MAEHAHSSLNQLPTFARSVLHHGKKSRRRRSQRQGSTLALTVFTMFVLFAFLAFSIDSGYLSGAKAELRRSADSASLAGCWELYNQLQLGKTQAQAASAVKSTAAQYVSANRVVSSDMTVDTGSQSQDIQVGYLASLTSNSAPSSDSSLPFMAVQVSLSKTAQKNGEIPFFFGKIFGRTGQAMDVSSTSVMARRISGFQLPASGGGSLNILPFAVDEQTWNNVCGSSNNTCNTGNTCNSGSSCNSNDDNYCFDASSNSVRSGCDSLSEVNLYPQGTGSPGNRGTVDIGGSNNSTADIARQICNGISKADLDALGKPLVIGAGGTLTLNGDTGISAGVKDELASIIGKTRIIPVFSSVSGNGNNAQYTIVKWVGVRVLAVKLTGSMSSKYVMVQPAPIITGNAVVAGSSAVSEGIYSPVLLAR